MVGPEVQLKKVPMFLILYEDTKNLSTKNTKNTKNILSF